MKTASVLLINPPFEAEFESVGGTRSIKRVLNVVPPLGIAYIGAVLERKGINVRIIDCAIGITYERLFKIILEERPDVIGITATTPSFVSSKRVANFVRENLSSAKILIGGVHVTASPMDTMKYSCFDVGVIGEGELTISELFDNYKNSEFINLDKINGIIYKKKDGQFIQTPSQMLIGDLDSIPLPARHLLPHPKNYRPTPASYRKLPYATIMTSRGCPSRCTFCDRSVFGGRARFRSASNIFEEIEELVGRYGVREIRFFDDTFTLRKDRVYAICDELMRRKLNIGWTCLTKVSRVDGELLKRMKAAGCWQVLYGFESGDDRMLRMLKKGNTVEMNKRAVRLTKEAGLEVRGDFIVGTPGETWESLKKTVEFAIKMKLDYAHFNKFVPFPGTELYENLQEEGFNFDFSRSSILDHKRVFYVPDGINKMEFSEYLNSANRKFYLRASYILKRLMSIKTFQQFKGQIGGLIAIKGL